MNHEEKTEASPEGLRKIWLLSCVLAVNTSDFFVAHLKLQFQ